MEQKVVTACAKAYAVRSMKMCYSVTGLGQDLTEYLAEIMK
jgi:hypothetical protein